MTFYKSFQTNNNKIEISKEEAKKMISESYGERTVDRYMNILLRDKIFGLSYFILFYEPTADTYCEDQECTFLGDSCGYYPSQCIAEKYGGEN
jgi:hypothetical protein